MIKHLIRISFISILLLSFSSNSFAQDSDGFIAVVTDVVTSTFKDVGIKIKDGRKLITLTPQDLPKYKDDFEGNQTIILEFSKNDGASKALKKGQRIKGLKIGDPDNKYSLTLENVFVKRTKHRRDVLQVSLTFREFQLNYTDAGRVTY